MRYAPSDVSVTPAFMESRTITDDSGQHAGDMTMSIDTVARATISPRHSLTVQHNLLLNEDQWQQLAFNRLSVNIWGTIKFTDVFGGKGKPRLKHFSRIGILWCDDTRTDRFRYEFYAPAGLGFSGSNEEEVEG